VRPWVGRSIALELLPSNPNTFHVILLSALRETIHGDEDAPKPLGHCDTITAPVLPTGNASARLALTAPIVGL
jgi:hypothetical protein